MRFSVLLPTRNRLDLLSRAIETVRQQDYDDWEIIVSDNFSEEDVGEYIHSLDESRIKYFRTNSFVPVTDNWNNALDKSTGNYVIMLGDDDGLMKGYFSTLSRLIDKFDSPDFVYTSALLYAYPGVLPTAPGGFLRMYSCRSIFQGAKQPFWLKKDKALGFVRDSFNFKLTFDYNMQFSLVSRKLIEQMRCYGAFYQSPYPDYYASNAMMLKAERILVVPIPLIAIGISPKSFGFYYFNDAEADGNAFLKNLPDRNMVSRLQTIFLPGPEMNTSWLVSMETVAVNFGRELDMQVNYARYRLVQIFAVYAGLIGGKSVGKTHGRLKKTISLGEWLRYGIAFSITAAVASMASIRYKTYLASLIAMLAGSHPRVSMPEIQGPFTTMLDVFEQIDPSTLVKRCE